MGDYGSEVLYNYLIIGFALAIFISYLITAIGWYKFYKTKDGYINSNAWMSFIPFMNNFIRSKFLEKEVNMPSYMIWFIVFKSLIIMIPFVGSTLTTIILVIEMTYMFYYLSKLQSPTYTYVIYLFLGIIFPYFLIKLSNNMKIKAI